jgi:hypothetical protein
LGGKQKLWEILAVEDQRNPSDFRDLSFSLAFTFSSSYGFDLSRFFIMAFNGQTPTIVVLKEGS